MLEDLLYDPVAAIYAFFKVRLDAFQAARARIMWFTPDVEDSSGFSTGKTFVNWALCNLRPLLIPDQRVLVIYQTFGTGKDQFWSYYSSHGTALFRSQLGRFSEEGEEEGRARSREASSWKMYYRNGGVVNMPAPGVFSKGRSLASLRCNVLMVDEWTKIEAMGAGEEGEGAAIFKQLFGRPTRESWNKEHPVWGNKVWMTATAELGNHPAAPRHRTRERRQRRGDPDVYCFGFSYKDYSNLECQPGVTFRERFRDDKRLKTMRDNLTPEAFLAEGLGLWGRSARGWFTESMTETGLANGAKRGVKVAISRAMDERQRPSPAGSSQALAYYFHGIDTAPAQGQRADDGALSVLRAIPLVEAPEHESDFQLDYIYDRVVRGHDAGQWSGLIHEKHRDFGFSLMVMDWGGGGQWVAPELKKDRQRISATDQHAIPIVRRDSPEVEGSPILCVVLRSDSGMQELWPDELKNARGDDVLKSLMHQAFRDAWAKGLFGVPPRHVDLLREANERRAEIEDGSFVHPLAGWPEEQMWASVQASVALRQMGKFSAATRPDGGWVMTRNGAHVFVSSDKDDLVDSRRNAYIAFRIWWTQEASGGFTRKGDDAEMCC